jgi:outer membrane immunogenic protein
MRLSTLLIVALLAMTGAMTEAAVADGMGPASSNRCCEVPTWSGVYAGFQAGGAWSDTGWAFPFAESFNAAAGQRFSTNLDGALVGGQLGINQQIGALLLGAELSFAGTSTHETLLGPPGFADERFKTIASSLLTATGRAGVVLDKHLIYGKAGYASANLDVSAVSGPPVPGISAVANHREDGWTAGAGWEYRIGRSLVFGIEYDYIDLSGSRFSSTTGGTVVGSPFHVDLDDLHMHTLTARLSILLDRSPTAPAAK